MASLYGISKGAACDYKTGHAGGTWYASASGSGGGASSGDPASLSGALASSACGSTIRLATGTYTGSVEVGASRVVMADTAQTITHTGLFAVPVGSGTVRLGGVDATSAVGHGLGQDPIILKPTGFAGDGTKMGVICLHGATGTARQMVDGVNFGSLKAILNAVAAAGYPVLGVTTGDTWGNDSAMTKIDAAKTYLQGTVGAKAGAIGLIGGSMGGANMLNWAKRNLASTACAVGLVPVSDITDMHTNNRGGLTTNINAAYGTWSEATYGAARNPVTFAAAGDLAGLDYLAYGGASDTVVIASTVAAVCTSIGGTATYTEVAGDHNSSLANMTPATIVAFLDANQT